MGLRNRLDTLRRESGAATAAPNPSRDDLARRLARLRPGAAAGPRVAPPKAHTGIDTGALATALGARVEAEQLLCLEQRWPVVDDPWLSRAVTGADARVRLPGAAVEHPGDCLFLDTETSGLAGGAGTVAFMVGLLRLTAGELRCRQYLLTGFGGEAALYDRLAAEADTARAVVSYNGGAFDMPLLAGRARLRHRPLPLADLPHIDLLHPVRRLFATRWPDCRLATVEQRLLDSERQDDVPGSQAPLAWFALLQRGDAERLPGVLSHNRIDLLTLARALPLLGAAHHDPERFGGDVAAVARGWLRAGDEARARHLLQSGTTLSARDRLELARLHRRAGDRAAALDIWRDLATAGHDEAVEQLAKHYEHHAGDPATALGYARRLGSEAGRARQRRLEQRLVARAAQAELAL